jgi:hypothetical protein
MTPAVTLFPIILAALLAATSLWVYQDATAHAERGRPVYFSVGAIEVSTPAAWAVGCLGLWVVFTPLYLTCRKNA